MNGGSNNHNLVIRTNDGLAATGTLRDRVNIARNGDISFYEDTGTTPKFFWDASAESLGIGDAAISNKLTLSDTADLGIQLTKIGSHSASIKAVSGAALAFGVDGSVGATERMRIDSSGNVGIGCVPANTLHLAGTSATPSLRLGSTSLNYYWDIGRENATTGDFVINSAANSSPAERMRIDSSGNVGIGVVPETDWGSTTDALQIGRSGAVWAGATANYVYLSSNVKFDGSNFQYITSDEATSYVQDANGNHIWQYAASGTG